MTTVRLTDKATTSTEAVKELRRLATFIESLTAVTDARVVVTGEMSVEVHFDTDPTIEPAAGDHFAYPADDRPKRQDNPTTVGEITEDLVARLAGA